MNQKKKINQIRKIKFKQRFLNLPVLKRDWLIGLIKSIESVHLLSGLIGPAAALLVPNVLNINPWRPASGPLVMALLSN